MSEDSFTDLSANEKFSNDSCSDSGRNTKFKAGDGFTKEYVQKTFYSRSDTISSSSQNDKSEYYARLLKETRQTVSNRDILIDMLQRQLKKMEELYRNTLNQQQDVRLKYFNAVQELAHQNIVCNKLKQGVFNLDDDENVYLKEKEALQFELEKVKKEYDELMKSTSSSMERNTCTINYAPNKQEFPSPGKMEEEILEHYLHIKQALTGQNEKLDKLLENVQVMGDGASTIIASLEGMRCANGELSKSLSSLTIEKPVQSSNNLQSMKENSSEEQQETPINQEKDKVCRGQNVSGDGKCRIFEKTDKGNQFLQIQTQKRSSTESLCSENSCKAVAVNGLRMSQCSCFSQNVSNAIIHPRTSEKASSIDCECLNYLYEVEDMFEENSKLQGLLQAATEEIKVLKQLVAGQPDGLRLISCSDPVQEYCERENKMKVENNHLKLLISKLESDLKKLSADWDCTSEQLELARKVRVESVQQSDRLLEEYGTSLEEINEKYLNSLTEIDALKKENNTLEEKVKLLNEIVEEHKDQCCLSKIELEKVNTRAMFLEVSLKELEDSTREKESQQSEEFAIAKTENLAIAEKYNELKKNYDALLENNEENGLLREKNENLLRELEERDVLIYELGEQVGNLEEDLNTMRKDMSENNEVASREMKTLMGACVELESKLELTKEILVNENNTIDAATNTSNYTLFIEMNNEDLDELKTTLDENADEIERLQEELEYSKTKYEKELKISRNQIELLQIQSEREQDAHKQEIKILETKLQQAEGNIFPNVKSISDSETETIQDRRDMEVLSKINNTSELWIPLEETQKQNKNLKMQLEKTKGELNKLKGKIKEFGVLKAENSKLKVEISNVQNLLSDMKDVEEDLKKSQKDKEEMGVKVQSLEDQLNAMESRRSSDKIKNNRKPSGIDQIVKEETVTSTTTTRKSTNNNNEQPFSCDDKSCQFMVAEEKDMTMVPTQPIRKSKINNGGNNYGFPCACDDKNYRWNISQEKALIVSKTQPRKSTIKNDIDNNNYERSGVYDKRYQMKTHVEITFKNKKSKAITSDKNKQRVFNLSTFGTVETGSKLKKIQMHLTNINQMEKRIADMTVSVQHENQRLTEYNMLRINKEKDMEIRLHQLKHKRQQLSKNFNNFQKQIKHLEYGACMPYESECDHLQCHCHSRNYKYR